MPFGAAATGKRELVAGAAIPARFECQDLHVITQEQGGLVSHACKAPALHDKTALKAGTTNAVEVTRDAVVPPMIRSSTAHHSAAVKGLVKSIRIPGFARAGATRSGFAARSTMFSSIAPRNEVLHAQQA
eukprot:CAMPEP_0183347670 /NCGR_PEP_ID=MMETSP0164_2-20130417/12424_1 /TAXON_ID=221442 /ORGANISM="Coccolithus pelagicus ssp braarudi, Strain PLY182g" /LENGTH=129 /DNA_ID=CAMNT_0025519139 /DNA_START=511 /DNA_END=900 /DNA_ORIENTATION=+